MSKIALDYIKRVQNNESFIPIYRLGSNDLNFLENFVLDHIHSNEGYVWYLRGLLISHHLGDHDHENKSQEHIRYFKKAIELGCYGAVCDLGYCYELMNEFDSAIMCYKQALDHNDCNAMTKLGNIYIGQDNVPEAIKYYQMAVDLNDVKAMKCLGNMYHEKHDDINAIKYYQMMIDHHDYSCLDCLCELYKSIGKYVESIKCYYLLYDHIGYYDSLVDEICELIDAIEESSTSNKDSYIGIFEQSR